MCKNKLCYAAIILLCSVNLFFAFGQRSGQEIKTGAEPARTVGNPGAPVVIEIFNDYQCPPCAFFNKELKRVQAKYAGRIQVIFRNYPLTTTHENALAAAQTAEAAGLQGKFVEMIDLLYENARDWAEAKNAKKLFLSYAQSLQLDTKRFSSDVESEEVQERIRLDVERAQSLHILGTPTAFLNRKELKIHELANLDQAIDAVLDPAKP
jgi:protein-disulfide isomerase